MTDRKLYTLYIDLYENGALKESGEFTQEERDAICAEIEELWTEQYRFETHRSEFVVGMSAEGDSLYLIYRKDGQAAAFPNDCGIREVTVGAPKVNEKTLFLIGDRIPIRLPGRRVHVMFSDV